MKYTLSLLLLLTALSAKAQLTITNSVKVALSTNDDNALRLAWKLDSNARTNGILPYTTVTNALTYGQYTDYLATEAFQAIAATAAARNEAILIAAIRTATDADRAKVARILAGLAN